MTDPTQPTPPDQPENYDIPDAVEQITPDMVGPSLVGHTINRLYRVEKMLGQGGMGWVSQVLHLRLLRREAMKLPMKDFMADAEYMKRFRREALTMARFEHPNIVQVYDVHIADSADDVSYITMEFVEGLSIDQYVLLHQNRLTVGDLLVMITKLAKALDKAHEKNVIHRDIKPANIAIKLSDEEPKLMDFGVARADIATAYKTEYHTTGANSSSFTAAYAAPEQIMGKPVTGAADIYAFAMTIYKLMGRRFPFDAENAAAFIIAQVQGTPIPLHERNPNWPTTLNTPLSKAMAKNPEDRQHSATQFAEELVQALSGYEKIPLVKMFDAQTALPPLAISSAPTLSVASVTIPAVLPGELVPPPKRMSGLVTAILSFLFFSLVGAGVYFVMDGKGAAFKDPGNYFPTLKARAQQAAAGDPSTLLPVWETPTPSATPSPSPTLTPTPSLTPSPTRSVTPSPSISPSPAPSPVVVVPTATPEPSPTPTPAPTEEPSPVPTESPTVSPTPTPEPTPSLVPTPREVKPFFAVSADEDAVSIIIIEEKFISSDRLTTVYPKRSESFLRRLAQTMNKPAVNAIAPDPSVPIAAGSEPFPFERIQWITDDPSQALLLAGKYMQWYGESLKGTPREVAPEKLREKITCAVSASLLDSTAMTNRSLSIPGCWAVEGGVLKWNPSQFSRVEARGRSGDSLEHVPFVCFNSQ